jgi:hypothetical protein
MGRKSKTTMQERKILKMDAESDANHTLLACIALHALH